MTHWCWPQFVMAHETCSKCSTIPNSKRWDYSDIPGGGQHLRKASTLEKPPTPTHGRAMGCMLWTFWSQMARIIERWYKVAVDRTAKFHVVFQPNPVYWLRLLSKVGSIRSNHAVLCWCVANTSVHQKYVLLWFINTGVVQTFHASDGKVLSKSLTKEHGRSSMVLIC